MSNTKPEPVYVVVSPYQGILPWTVDYQARGARHELVMTRHGVPYDTVAGRAHWKKARLDGFRVCRAVITLATEPSK